jgi:hypothetical protein
MAGPETNLTRTETMASAGKKKTTMAKISRESRLRERRQDKEARKRARRDAAANPPSEPQDVLLPGQVEPDPTYRDPTQDDPSQDDPSQDDAAQDDPIS